MTEKKKRKPSIRIEFENEAERNARHLQAKEDGLQLIPWVKWKCGWTAKPKKQVRTPRQEALDKRLDALENIYDEIKEQPTSELKEATMYSILTLFKYIMNERDDSKVQSPRKRPKAD